MRLTLITPARMKSEPCRALIGEYVKRASRYRPMAHEELALPRQSTSPENAALTQRLERAGSRHKLVILDERGKLMDSRKFAETLTRWRDDSVSEVLFAVGGPHGYSEELKKQAHLLWSLSPMTMPHELAAATAAEQIYRGLTLMAGHPYHND
jgi:23S rRNA (pseudouridine1915-N3)-methyltransferase